jgi:hypothetical protein
MAAPLQTCMKEQRFVIRVLISEGVKPETKRTSKEWRHSLTQEPKKFWTQPSAGKIMLTIF